MCLAWEVGLGLNLEESKRNFRDPYSTPPSYDLSWSHILTTQMDSRGFLIRAADT